MPDPIAGCDVVGLDPAEASLEVEASLRSAGFVLDEVREAPDRPGREMVFVARRP